MKKWERYKNRKKFNNNNNNNKEIKKDQAWANDKDMSPTKDYD